MSCHKTTLLIMKRVKDPVGMSGIRLEADFHIITAQTTAININKCVCDVQYWR